MLNLGVWVFFVCLLFVCLLAWFLLVFFKERCTEWRKFLEQFWGLHLKTSIEDQEKRIWRRKVWEAFHLKIILKLFWMNCHGKEKQRSGKMSRKISLIELTAFPHNLASLVRNIWPRNSLSGAVYFFLLFHYA